MDETHDQSTLTAMLTEAAARRRGGYYFHLGDDPVALPVAELYGRALLRAAQLGREGLEKGTWWASWAPIPRYGRNGPGAPGWRDVPWFRFPLLFEFAILRHSPHKWLLWRRRPVARSSSARTSTWTCSTTITSGGWTGHATHLRLRVSEQLKLRRPT